MDVILFGVFSDIGKFGYSGMICVEFPACFVQPFLRMRMGSYHAADKGQGTVRIF